MGGLRDSVDAYQRNEMWTSSSISHQFWFPIFIEDVHKRAGEVVKEDKAFTTEAIHECKRLSKLEWQQTNISYKKGQKSLRWEDVLLMLFALE